MKSWTKQCLYTKAYIAFRLLNRNAHHSINNLKFSLLNMWCVKCCLKYAWHFNFSKICAWNRIRTHPLPLSKAMWSSTCSLSSESKYLLFLSISVVAFYQCHYCNNLWMVDHQWSVVKVASLGRGVRSLADETLWVDLWSPFGSLDVIRAS